ncbi:YqzK family protein [Pseudalkalibacillus caeni]|uniref:DUF4227 family protein n=1 Tax=Exobacillus caeni TaxID=2574798 RepID=A0A5R9F7B7_9BACL|nr:YqzK family protein [Pseudalkalibacillus caeni]TLS35665.1 DUF4227 family protein [Pseudalkalibacillus caeni]
MRKGIVLVWDTVKVFGLFTICTLLFYYGLLWVNQEYQNYHRYDEPQGKAVKVIQMETTDAGSTWGDRLQYFLRNGE